MRCRFCHALTHISVLVKYVILIDRLFISTSLLRGSLQEDELKSQPPQTLKQLWVTLLTQAMGYSTDTSKEISMAAH